MVKKSIRVLNKDEYLSDNVEKISSDNVEVIIPKNNSTVSSFDNTHMSSKGISESTISLPIPVIDGIIDILNNAINAFRDVAVEREKTNQVRAQSRAFIEGQREETNRTRIVEEATTKRYEMEITSEIEKSKLELIKQKNEIEADLINNKLDYQIRVLVLRNMQDSIKVIIEQHREYSNMLKLMFNEVINKEFSIDDFCKIAGNLNEVEKSLIIANEKLDIVVKDS